VQGLPASVLGIVVYLYLQDKPEDARWLTPAEKATLRHHLDHDAQTVEVGAHASFWSLLRDPKIYTMSLVYFLLLGANYTLVFYAPSLIKSWGVNDVFTVGLLSAIGPVFAVVCMVFIGRSSDKRFERRWHFLFTVALASLGICITIFAKGNLVVSMLGLTLMSIGQTAATPIFFAALSEYVPRKTAAGGIALVSSLGNLGPAVMPSLTALMAARTGSMDDSMFLVIALWMGCGFILLAAIRPARAAKVKLAAA